MAGSVNKVILVGNLGADPEIRRLNSGDPVVNLRVATTETWRDRNSGDRQERTAQGRQSHHGLGEPLLECARRQHGPGELFDAGDLGPGQLGEGLDGEFRPAG